MTLSDKMQSVFDELNITNKNVMFMPIAQVHFDRIADGSKKVEFRDASVFYIRKLAIVDKDYNYVDDKPIKYILLQVGYSKTSNRMLIELKDWFVKSEETNLSNTDVEKVKYVINESFKDGFEENDEYLALLFGDIMLIE